MTLPTPFTHCGVRTTTGEESTHSLSTLRSSLTRVDQYRRTPHGSGMCVHVCCVCGPLGARQAVTTHRVWECGADPHHPYSLSECDTRVGHTFLMHCGWGSSWGEGQFLGVGHLMHSSLPAKSSSSHECLVVLAWLRWEGRRGEGRGRA